MLFTLCIFSHSINQQNAPRQVQHNRNHKAHSTLSAISYMFRHKFAIFREFNNNECLRST